MKLNDLHISSDIKLIFMANDFVRKGRSNKSYTIKIVNDQHNDEMLEQLFTSKGKRKTVFDCVYRVENVTIKGLLKITSIEKTHAEGTFISGNGKLWESLTNKNLREYDFSALNHTLSLANVTASETAGDLIYDLTDRGHFMEDATFMQSSAGDGSVIENRRQITNIAKIDISERYPALKLKMIFETIMHEEGYGITWLENVYNQNLDDVYLLYTGDGEIENDDEWLQSAVFEANGDETIGKMVYTLDEIYKWETRLRFPDEQSDDGNNFSASTSEDDNIYTVPTTGTYGFRLGEFMVGNNIEYTIVGADTVSSSNIVIGIYNLTSETWVQKYTKLDAGDHGYIPLMFDSKPRHFIAGDQIIARVQWAVNATSSAGFYTLEISQANIPFLSYTSRYYGAGSTVEVSKLLPDMTALEFFSMISNTINLYTFYRDETHILECELGRMMKPAVLQITPVDSDENVKDNVNYRIKFDTDKELTPEDITLDNGKSTEQVINIDMSRTYIGNCMRLLYDSTIKIPVLWEDSSPTSWITVTEFPDWKIKANCRLLRYKGQQTKTYKLTYGGGDVYREELRSELPLFEDLDYLSLFRFETLEDKSEITFVARVDINYIYSQSVFKYPVYIEGYGVYWVQECKQKKGDIFQITAKK